MKILEKFILKLEEDLRIEKARKQYQIITNCGV